MWCRREVAWWVEQGRVQRMLILQSGGDISLGPDRGDFDWTRTNALSQELVGRFAEEPLLVDLRAIRRDPPPTLRDSEFRRAIVAIAARCVAFSPRISMAKILRLMRRNRRILVGGTAATLLALGAASWQTRQALNNERERLASDLASAAHNANQAHPDQALLMALASHGLGPGGSGTVALVRALQASPHLVRYVAHAGNSGGRVTTAAAIDAGAGFLVLAYCSPANGSSAKESCAAHIEWEPLRDGVTLPASRDLPEEWGAIRDVAVIGGGRELLVRADGGLFRLPLASASSAIQLVLRGRPVAAGAEATICRSSQVALQTGRPVWRVAQGIHRCNWRCAAARGSRRHGVLARRA